MKTFVTKNIVNLRLQTFFFVFFILMHIASATIKAQHPLLAWFLTTLEAISWFAILTISIIVLVNGIQHKWPVFLNKGWVYACSFVRRKRAKTFVSLEQLKHLQSNIDRLGLALHGMTPEMEQARRAHFQMLGDAVPALVVPAQNRVLYSQFEGLIRFLTHVGFPHLESVRLQYRDLAFVQMWGSELEARLQQVQRNHGYQVRSMYQLFDEVSKKFEHISSHYPQVQSDAGYQQIQGAFKLLSKMVRQSHCPEEMIGSLTALLQDMEHLQEHLNQFIL